MALPITESADDFPHAGMCKNCGRPFIRARRWQEFCRDVCRADFNKRGWAVSLVSREYASVREAAKLTGVSESTIRRWAQAGRIRSESYFGRIVVLRGDLERARANRGAAHKRGSEGQEMRKIGIANRRQQRKMKRSKIQHQTRDH